MRNSLVLVAALVLSVAPLAGAESTDFFDLVMNRSVGKVQVAINGGARRIPMLLVLLACAPLSLFPFYWMLSGTTLNSNDVLLGILLPGRDFLPNWKQGTTTYNVIGTSPSSDPAAAPSP